VSIYVQKVVLWPLEIDGTNDLIVFEDTGIPTSNNQSLANIIYLTSGDGVAVSPVDLLVNFSAAMNAAAAALGLAGVFRASRTSEGHCKLDRTGGVSPGDNLVIRWDLSTFPKAILGFDTDVTTTISILAQTGDNMMDYQWMPGKPEVHSDPDLQQILASEDLSVGGRPSRVVHSPSPFYRREIIWERLWAARLIQSRADDAAYATPADMTTGEDMTWENMRDYLVGDPGPTNDNRVYVLQTNINPLAADRTGPYEVILSESDPDIFGVQPSSYVQSLAAEQYDCSIMLWKA
jgi:hypothetical protein